MASSSPLTVHFSVHRPELGDLEGEMKPVYNIDKCDGRRLTFSSLKYVE